MRDRSFQESRYAKGPHIDWWNSPERDRFSLLKKHGYQDAKKPWKYQPLTDKGIFLIWKAEVSSPSV